MCTRISGARVMTLLHCSLWDYGDFFLFRGTSSSELRKTTTTNHVLSARMKGQTLDGFD